MSFQASTFGSTLNVLEHRGCQDLLPTPLSDFTPLKGWDHSMHPLYEPRVPARASPVRWKVNSQAIWRGQTTAYDDHFITA